MAAFRFGQRKRRRQGDLSGHCFTAGAHGPAQGRGTFSSVGTSLQMFLVSGLVRPKSDQPKSGLAVSPGAVAGQFPITAARLRSRYPAGVSRGAGAIIGCTFRCYTPRKYTQSGNRPLAPGTGCSGISRYRGNIRSTYPHPGTDLSAAVPVSLILEVCGRRIRVRRQAWRPRRRCRSQPSLAACAYPSSSATGRDRMFGSTVRTNLIQVRSHPTGPAITATAFSGRMESPASRAGGALRKRGERRAAQLASEASTALAATGTGVPARTRSASAGR